MANLHIPGPALDQGLQALQLVHRQDLVQFHVRFQCLGAVKGEPEAVQDSPRVAELGEELHDELAGDGGHGCVVVGDLEHQPRRGKLHDGSIDGLENPRRMKRDSGKIRRFIPGTVNLADLSPLLCRFLVYSGGIFNCINKFNEPKLPQPGKDQCLPSVVL